MGKAARQQSARERMRAERQHQERQDKLKRKLLITGSAVLVLVVAVGVAVLVQTQRAQGGGQFQGNLPAPEVSEGSVAYSAGGASTPVLEVYEDFRCPHCAELERRSGEMLKRLAAEGSARVVYHPVAIIDQGSMRAGAASLCAAQEGAFMQYHDLLFEHQQDAAPFPLSTLTDYAGQVGVDSGNFESCVREKQARIQKNTQATQQLPGFEGTPTVYLNDEKLSSDVTYNPDSLRQAVLDAGAG